MTGSQFSSSITLVLGIIALGVETSFVGAQPSDNHRYLSGAATWAVETSNIELLKALLQAGVQINEPVDEKQGWSLLHFAASTGTESMVCFLRDNGADLFMRDLGGVRPIDLAFKYSRTNICQVLANTGSPARLIDRFPVEVLEAVFPPQQSDTVLISINGKDPSGDLLKWIFHTWPNAVPGSKGEIATNTVTGEKYYRIIGRKEKIASCAATIERLNEKEYSWFISFASDALSGWFQEGKARQEYGYWLVNETKGGQL